ncbi:MAG: carbohydrate kinase family protein [Anaerolineae bacterium]|nr:carbohydrate kinase family protein [Anaerolineae bacterium]
MSHQPELVIVGPLNIDIIAVGQAPLEPEALQQWMGLSKVSVNAAGSAGYVLMDLQRLGVRCGVISTVGSDPLSAFLMRALHDAGVDTARVRVQPGTTSAIAIYMLLFGSKKRPLTGQVATHAPWPAVFSDADFACVAGARLLHVAGYLHYPDMWGAYMAELCQHARTRGLIVSLDPQFPLVPVDPPWMVGLEGLIAHVDVFLSDEDEARSIVGIDDLDRAAAALLAAGPHTVVIKRGAQGSLIYHAGGERIAQPPYPVPEAEVSDSIGAGDAFDAGFLYGVLEGWPLARCGQFASTVAAMSLRGPGGTEAVPDRAAVERACAACFGG